MTGRLITIEGPEGAGKTTLAQGLKESLSGRGIQAVVTREPGAGRVGAMIRTLLLDCGQLEAWAEAFLFLADRAQHCSDLIRPALSAGQWVICDRFTDSTIVYQGHGRGLDVERLRELNAIATGGLTPDMTILLDLPVALGLSRLGERDRLDRESVEFHERVRQGFLKEASREPGRWRVIDAATEPAVVLDAALKAIEGLVIGSADRGGRAFGAV